MNSHTTSGTRAPAAQSQWCAPSPLASPRAHELRFGTWAAFAAPLRRRRAAADRVFRAPVPRRYRAASLLPVIAAKDEHPAGVLTTHSALQDKFELPGDGEAEQMVALDEKENDDDDKEDEE